MASSMIARPARLEDGTSILMHPAGPAPARGRSRDPRRSPNRDALPLQSLEDAPAQLVLHPVLIGERRHVVAHREVERAVGADPAGDRWRGMRQEPRDLPG